mgnify:CR=1 FL=1
MNHKINFKSSFKEPILLSGRIFGLKLLSAYEIIILERNYKTMLEISNVFRRNKKLVKKAGLISMCLYTASGERLFSNAVSVLKNLTCHEINYVFKQYSKIKQQSLAYHAKNQAIFENVKKHEYQQSLQNLVSHE